MAFPSSNRFYKNIRVPFNLLELLEHHPPWWIYRRDFSILSLTLGRPTIRGGILRAANSLLDRVPCSLASSITEDSRLNSASRLEFRPSSSIRGSLKKYRRKIEKRRERKRVWYKRKMKGGKIEEGKISTNRKWRDLFFLRRWEFLWKESCPVKNRRGGKRRYH